ncbi:MAG: sugar phosphate isomerase/epimerase, partial [Spirochaetes bacterium]|nr:sugar phosphate isomerase/epimerase [Spirochaetota bacterium]
MILTGIADEASPSLDEQLDANEELGWASIELRSVGKTNVCEMDEAAFDGVADAVEARRFFVPCLASGIANWSRPITADFPRDVADLRRAAPRMRRLGTRLIRIMSWPNDGLAEDAWRAEALRRLRELAQIAAGEGIVLALENCSGWASASPATLRGAVEEIGSANLRILFDTGNAVGDRGGHDDSWRFYEAARPYICHVHVKDCAPGPAGEAVYGWPGEGWGMVREILADLAGTDYDGAVSIEPHISGQIHKGSA